MSQANNLLHRDPLSVGVFSPMGETPRVLRPIPPHSGVEPREFPLEPVIERLRPPGAQSAPHAGHNASQGEITRVAFRLGVSLNWVRRNMAQGGLEANVADAVAIRLGCHPVEIWPDWFSHVPTDEECELAERRTHLRAAHARRQARKFAPIPELGPEACASRRAEMRKPGRVTRPEVGTGVLAKLIQKWEAEEAASSEFTSSKLDGVNSLMGKLPESEPGISPIGESPVASSAGLFDGYLGKVS
jgi:hypothetical protein